jgi:nucleotide-binding universal stress UspA family protein
MIVLCFDGSEESKHAIRVAAELVADREAVVVDVISDFTGVEGDAVVTPDADVPQLRDLNRDAALELAEEGVALARRHGFSAERRAVFAGPVWEGIVEVARDVDATLIVVGSSGVSGIRELVQGSTSHDLARHARRPVLIVPAND